VDFDADSSMESQQSKSEAKQKSMIPKNKNRQNFDEHQGFHHQSHIDRLKRHLWLGSC